MKEQVCKFLIHLGYPFDVAYYEIMLYLWVFSYLFV